MKKSGTDVLVIEKTMEEVVRRQKKRLELDFVIFFLEDLMLDCLNIDHEQPDPSTVFKPQKVRLRFGKWKHFFNLKFRLLVSFYI